MIAFFGAGLLHLAFDLPLHHEDARRHFWPISDAVFRSPVSYWDPRHYGHIAAPVEVMLCLALSVVLWRRFQGWFARTLILIGAGAELLPGVMFMIMFAG